MKKTALLVGIALLGIAASPKTPKPKAQVKPAIADLDSRLLAAHNAERAVAGAPPLQWSAKLAADAKGWAERLVMLGRMEHADLEDAGENLWMGARGSFPPEAMVGAWIKEKKDFKIGIFPDVSTTGKWEDIGHYTQVIWRDTTQVGCALASNAKSDFLVCRYTPVGNSEGESITNRK